MIICKHCRVEIKKICGVWTHINKGQVINTINNYIACQPFNIAEPKETKTKKC
jgi:hypothetical protein